MQRILISNEKSKFYRICAFSFNKDAEGEDYVKFSFPDLRNVKAEKAEDNSIMEFTTHFISGVSHFKTSDQQRVHRNESESKFKDSGLIHLVTYTLYDLSHFKEFRKKLNEGDYQIGNIFDPVKGKVLEFYLSRLIEEINIPSNARTELANLEWRQFHPFESRQKNYRMIMIEYDFKQKDRIKSGVSIFRQKNQQAEHTSVELPEDLKMENAALNNENKS